MITLDLNVKSVLWHINVHCSITKWIESGQKNCSQCRAGCEKKTIVKLFFSQNELGKMIY